jgi:hypothetical protein
MSDEIKSEQDQREEAASRETEDDRAETAAHGGHTASAQDAPEQDGEVAAPMSACGLGGCLVLHPNYLEIQHFGVLYILVEFLSFHIPRLNVKILRSQITAIEIVRPILLPDYLVISYAGAPDVKGGYLRRAFAPNALMMRYLENRDFFTILERFGHGLH